jgi:uncharacterized tellurite resistance protein B-like protein
MKLMNPLAPADRLAAAEKELAAVHAAFALARTRAVQRSAAGDDASAEHHEMTTLADRERQLTEITIPALVAACEQAEADERAARMAEQAGVHAVAMARRKHCAARVDEALKSLEAAASDWVDLTGVLPETARNLRRAERGELLHAMWALAPTYARGMGARFADSPRRTKGLSQ